MNDTIVAISTALGVGAISIVRMSGPEAITIANSVFSKKDLTKVESHTINYGNIVENNEIIDEVLVSIMKSPKTFTAEDIVEINCHGGILITSKILEILLKKGCRLAEPGEFTKRAFLNGRIDLAQSEAVMDLIDSKSDHARKVAISQLKGKTSNLIDNFREELLQVLSSIEVNIDYPEYNDIEVMTLEKINKIIITLNKKLDDLIVSSKNNTFIKEGIKTVIVGRPNVGKSSLLNQMLEYDKAIVTDIAGTTRDIVEGEINLDGIILNMIDTAGIRETKDKVEKLGVEKSINLINEADLVIIVLNGNESLTKEDRDIIEKAKVKPCIIVINKNDLQKNIEEEKIDIKNIVSTNTNELNGIINLKNKIKEMFNLEEIVKQDLTYLTNARQVSLAIKAKDYLTEAKNALENNVPVDMIAIDLNNVFTTLGEIIGKNYSEEVIDNLFERFCVGK